MKPPTMMSHPASVQELAAVGLPQDFQPHTPLNIAQFAEYLDDHPNRPLVEWALATLRYGARLNYTGNREGFEYTNLKSATTNADVLRENIQKEVASGNILRMPHKQNNIKYSPLGVVPKPRSDKFRTINHLSFPIGTSINDGIGGQHLYTHYNNYDAITPWLREYGSKAWLAGVDVENVFRIIPVHPVDIALQGIQFEGIYYLDLQLVFGCKSSPVIFNTFAALWNWIFVHHGRIRCLQHYLDDFILVTGNQKAANLSMNIMKLIANKIQLPLKKAKEVPPTQIMTHLGIAINTITMTFSIPEDRVKNICSELDTWSKHKYKTLGEFWSLAGWLIWACTIIPTLRPFIQPFFQRIAGKHFKHAKIPITKGLKSTILDIKTLLTHSNHTHWYNRKIHLVSQPHITIYTDASLFGAGIWVPSINQHAQFNITAKQDIFVNETHAALVALHHFCHKIKGTSLTLIVDNMALAESLYKGASKNTIVNDMLCTIALILNLHQISLHTFYISSQANLTADLLSRQKWDQFTSFHPHSQRQQLLTTDPSAISKEVRDGIEAQH